MKKAVYRITKPKINIPLSKMTVKEQAKTIIVVFSEKRINTKNNLVNCDIGKKLLFKYSYSIALKHNFNQTLSFCTVGGNVLTLYVISQQYRYRW